MMAGTKNALRQQMRLLLRNMPPDEKDRQSLIITQKVVRHAKFAAAERICVYLNTDDEVSTSLLLQEIWKNRKTCFIPRYDPKSRDMQMLLLRSMDDLKSLPLTSWNIRQPDMDDVREDAADSGGLHLIIVPGLAFTQSGHRLGSGRGYYDRYFEQLFSSSASRPFLLALAFSQQVLPHIPTGPFDVAVDEVVTCDSGSGQFRDTQEEKCPKV